MSADEGRPEKGGSDDLRRLAEEKLSGLTTGSSDLAGQSLAEVVHELGVHQVQLEMQNEELRQAHLEIETSRDRYLELYDFAPVGLLTLSREALIVEANLGAAALLGVERRSLLGKPFRLHVPAARRDAWDQLFTGLLRVGGRRGLDLELSRDDGVAIAVALDCIWQTEPGGEPRLCVALVDVTERERAAAEVRRLNEELERRVHDRTAELESFVYSVAHDLKAPLRAIDSYSQILVEERAGQLDEEGLGLLGRLRVAAQQMARQISGLLDYSRMSRGEIVAHRIELRDLVARVVAGRSEAIRLAGAEVHVNVPPFAVIGVVDALEAVVSNLLDNALKFHSPEAVPVVEIGASQQGVRCRLWVRDQGIGFDMLYHGQIFELFRRLGHSEEFEGTGVGLALVHRAMERMGGRVWAESCPGEGSTFFIELPT